jgi:hypothetical protein
MLWFSAHPHWEPTATKNTVSKDGTLRRLSFDEQVQHGGCIRFALSAEDARLMNWEAACATAGTPRDMRRELERRGRSIGANHAHWFATAVPIALRELQLQVYVGFWGNAEATSEMAQVWARTRSHQIEPTKLARALHQAVSQDQVLVTKF